jgi:O-antigen ligase
MRRRALQLIVFLIALAASYGTAQARDVYPAGILTDSSMQGVYAGPDPGGCCWLAPSATFSVVAPRGSNVLLLLLAAPPYAVPSHGEQITVRINSAAPYVTCCVRPGVQEIAIPLGARAPSEKRLRITITSGGSFVPAKRGLGVDTRRLTFLLQKVTVFDTIQGMRYVNGVDSEALPIHRNMLALSWMVIFAGGFAAFFLTRRDAAFAWISLLVTAPFDFSVPFAGTTATLAKSALLGCTIALLMRRDLRSVFGERGFRIALGAFVLFLGSIAISDFHASYAGPALRETLKAMQYLLTIAVAYCAYRFAPRPEILRVAVLWSVALVAALALAQEVVGAPQSRMILAHAFPRIGGPLEGPNQLGAYLGVLLPLVFAFVLWRGPRVLDIIVLTVGLATVLLTFSRGGVLACAFALGIVAALRSPMRNKSTVWAAAGIIAAMAGLVVLSLAGVVQLHSPLSPAEAYNGGLGTRSGLWHAAMQLWATSPVIGVGPGNFEVLVGNILPGVRTHPNNYFLQILAEEGALGFAAFVFFNLVLVRECFRAARTPAGAAALAVIFAMAAHQLLDGLLEYPKVGIVFFAVVAIGLAEAASQRYPLPESPVNARTAVAL